MRSASKAPHPPHVHHSLVLPWRDTLDTQAASKRALHWKLMGKTTSTAMHSGKINGATHVPRALRGRSQVASSHVWEAFGSPLKRQRHQRKSQNHSEANKN